jgi:hypothetical protein
MRAIIRLVGGSLLALSCASAPTPPPPTPAPAAALPVEQHLLQDRAWGVLRSPSLGLKLALPEAKAWRPAPAARAAGASWELRHEPTSTRLSVRRWRASRLPRVEACEAELRARTPDLPSVDESNLVSRRDAHVPQGFVTRITLVASPGTTTRVAGYAIAVGAGVGECLAAIAKTECSSELELAERLRLLDAALGHIRLTQIEDRVPAPAKISP